MTTSLLELCQALHGCRWGSSDDYADWAVPSGDGEAERKRDLEILRARLAKWREGPERAKAYDDAVKALVQATLDEWESP